jgi:adenylate kinase family enzyme
VVHIDHIHWQPGWIERPRAEKTRLCREAEAGAAWIFEGGHSASWETRLARAEMLIWLDLPVALRFWRILRRTTVQLGRQRPDLPEGCREGFHRETLPFWHFVWRTRASARARLLGLWQAVPEGKVKVRLTTRREVQAFVDTGEYF